MKFLKNNLKGIILVIILIVIASGVSVYATAQYYATQVDYKDGKSVAKALDELYSMKDNKYSNSQYIQYGEQQYERGKLDSKGTTYNYGSGTTTDNGIITFNMNINEPSEIWIWYYNDNNKKGFDRYIKTDNGYTSTMLVINLANNYGGYGTEKSISVEGTRVTLPTNNWGTQNFSWVVVK